MRIVLAIACTLMLAACSTTGTTTGAQVPYPNISHRNTAEGDLPSVSLRHNDRLIVTITDTNDDCFTYNAKELQDTSAAAAAGRHTVELEVLHDETFKGYEILVRRKAGTADVAACKELSEARWVIPVLSDWRIAMSGAVTFDRLTDPVYHLEPGNQTVNNENVSGFFVRRDKDDEDVVRSAAGAMAHLYNIDWKGWVPLTFGVSVSDNPTYLVGTGVRFGQQGHLTIGAAIGPRAHLPAHLNEGSFVTDANAINTLGSKNEIQMFVAVSLSFLERNLGKLTGLIKPAED